MAAPSDRRLEYGDLSQDQREVYDSIRDWVNSTTPLLTAGGFAGTGKSTLLGVLAAELYKKRKTVAYVAFTGRASSVLDRKLRACGVQTTGLAVKGEDDHGDMFANASEIGRRPFCGTIHSLMYKSVVDEDTDELTGWVKREHLDREYSLIVVDEASMVGSRLYGDLAGYGVPILAVGDHGQLPPVMDTGELMRDPMLRLEKIHRQAEGSPIIALSRVIREEGSIDIPKGNSTVRRRPYSEIGDVLREAYGMGANALEIGALCYTNRMRIRLNGEARKALGRKGPPVPGEVLICLKNRPPVFNGMRGIVKEAKQGYAAWHLDASIAFPEEGLDEAPYTLCAAQFNRDQAFASVEELQDRGIACDKMREAGDLYDFGYALTTHKSQGSSFRHVIFYLDRDEKPWEEDWRRFAYTAVTRASSALTIVG